MNRLVVLGLFAACAGAVVALPTPGLDAAVDGPAWFAAGDSVRFVARFTVPAGVDSVVVSWSLGTNPNQVHVKRPPFAAPAVDSVKFASPPLSPGGSSFTGGVTIQTWKLGVGSAGVSKAFDVKRPPPAPPADVSALTLVDSAVAFP